MIVCMVLVKIWLLIKAMPNLPFKEESLIVCSGAWLFENQTLVLVPASGQRYLNGLQIWVNAKKLVT